MSETLVKIWSSDNVTWGWNHERGTCSKSCSSAVPPNLLLPVTVSMVITTAESPGGSFLSAHSEGKSSSTSDLQTPGSKVKRHSSLVTSLSSKAMRVKSRITGSFFNKGTLLKRNIEITVAAICDSSS